ncbi:carbohydrate kinase [Patellaria atrata CBS 101060]|uniref:Gluconokinase n=1 Tax=Patellaria atrata CBS 101060 TaxID=1346257 RepID=A0A9P4SGK8_9PEZI|nr:carbohydrate kinase [Patellaria atrata CBS 101060]
MLSYDQANGHVGPSAPPTSTMNPSLQAEQVPLPPHHRHIWIITGPAGCGKSTVAKYIADTFSLPYIEGDEFHPQANIEKMANGIALTDADRWDWLILLRQQSLNALSTGAPGVVLTCSALKRKYRDVIRIASYNDHDVLVHFVYLKATEETLLVRVKARQGHYMKDSMVRSQFASLEPPVVDPNDPLYEKDVLSVDVSGSMAEVQQLVLAAVNEVMARDAYAES